MRSAFILCKLLPCEWHITWWCQLLSCLEKNKSFWEKYETISPRPSWFWETRPLQSSWTVGSTYTKKGDDNTNDDKITWMIKGRVMITPIMTKIACLIERSCINRWENFKSSLFKGRNRPCNMGIMIHTIIFTLRWLKFLLMQIQASHY